MTDRRDNPLPLILGLMLAVIVHLTAASPAWVWLNRTRSLTAPPDLRIENVVVPDNVLLLDADNDVSFDVVNRGGQFTGDLLWRDRVYYSADDQLDADDTLLIDAARVEPLAPGQRYRSAGHNARLAAQVELPFYLIFVTDADNAIEERWHEDNNVYVRRFEAPVEPQPRELAVGRPDAPQRVTVAWISHEDFQKLVAPPSITEQPALQNVAEPIPGAPLELNPAPPQMATNQEQAVSEAESGGSLADAPVVAPQPNPGPLAELPTRPGHPDLQNAPGEGDSSATASAQSAAEDATPTSVPRDEAQSDPVLRTEEVDVHPLASGSVLVGKGITVKPARPYFSPAVRFAAVADNPKADITFDRSGKVIDAKLTQSSGTDSIDAPILRSLYQWKASGEQIDALGDKGKLIMPVNLILIER
ncbi:MAG: hypothetical protein IT445_07855 [Phycisphaeraceae bacterium]|nr:hypothetical protein [Phycisphaeraceae bacterium]